MIPVGTSVNPGELRSGPKWEKTFISYLQPPTLSLESTCRNHIVSTFETLCCPPGNHIVSNWKPNGVHLETTWCAHGNHIISTWQPCTVHRNYMVSVGKPCGGHMETMWFSHGNYVVSIFESTYCPPGNHMVSTWKLGGVHLDTIWC